MNKIFYNTEVYDSYQDYALGGFLIQEGVSINYSTIYSEIYDRIEYLIEDYISRGMKANRFDDTKFSKENALVYVGFMVKDYLGFYPENLSVEGLRYSIIESDQMNKWLNIEIKERIKKYPLPQFATTIGIPNIEPNDVSVESRLYMEALDATTKMTLEEYLEQLSLIEL